MKKKPPDHRTNFFYLLGVLVLLLVAIPFANDLQIIGPEVVRAVFYSILMIVGVRSLKGGHDFFKAGIGIAVIGIVFSFLALDQSSTVYQYASTLSLIAFLLVAITFTLRQVVFGTELDTNRLVGAICVYLLLGVIWALFYSLIDLAVPASFEGIGEGTSKGLNSDWLYFSFVTLTTLGYGDITPLSATARSLAYMEAIAGQFYVAILVAGLVSAYISDKQSSN